MVEQLRAERQAGVLVKKNDFDSFDFYLNPNQRQQRPSVEAFVFDFSQKLAVRCGGQFFRGCHDVSMVGFSVASDFPGRRSPGNSA